MALSDLQLSLIGVGGAGIAAVWIYNKWQERQHRKAAERVFRGSQPDVLLDPQGEPAAPPAPAPGERLEPVLTDIAEEDAAAPSEAEPTPEPAAIPEPPEALVDGLVDCIVGIEPTAPTPGHALWEAQLPLAGRLAKPLRWVGLDGDGQWHAVHAHDARVYRNLCAALQLADRQGAASDGDLAAFYEGVADVARNFDAGTDFPPVDQVLTHARAVDRFCADVDIQIALHMVHRDGQTIAGSKLRGIAEAAGLQLDGEGFFHRRDAAGQTLYTIANLGGQAFAGADSASLDTHGVTFWLDVPRVAEAAAVFDQMLEVAGQMSVGLDGILVDDQRNPLSDAALAGIRDKVAEIERQMATQGIPGGGTRALRLFS